MGQDQHPGDGQRLTDFYALTDSQAPGREAPPIDRPISLRDAGQRAGAGEPGSGGGHIEVRSGESEGLSPVAGHHRVLVLPDHRPGLLGELHRRGVLGRRWRRLLNTTPSRPRRGVLHRHRQGRPGGRGLPLALRSSMARARSIARSRSTATTALIRAWVRSWRASGRLQELHRRDPPGVQRGELIGRVAPDQVVMLNPPGEAQTSRMSYCPADDPRPSGPAATAPAGEQACGRATDATGEDFASARS